jgi:hypothetical protein
MCNCTSEVWSFGPSRNDVYTHLRVLAAQCVRVLHDFPSEKQRAQETPGAAAPAASRAKLKSTRAIHHRFTGATQRFLRNGFNGLYRALPGDRAFLPPSSAEDSANLTPASGRQDHTALPSASQRSRQQRRLRPPHPVPYVRDDRDTPLIGNGTARNVQPI